MSSELDTVKNQVQQAARGIDDAALAVQTAYSNADDKKERLNALGVHASYQGLEQTCEKLREAMNALGSAHGEAGKAATELHGVETTTPIPECLPKLGSAASELGTARTGLNTVAELVRNAKTDAEQVGVEGIVAGCQSALDMIDIARSTGETAINAVTEYHKRLEREADEINGLSPGTDAARPGSVVGPADPPVASQRVADTTAPAATPVSDEPPASAPKSVIEQFVERRKPMNHKYAGQQFPLPDHLAEKYPQGVKFDEHGFPDFSPHAKHIVKIKMRGNRKYGPNGDFGDANEEAGYPRGTMHKGYTWHHLHDRTTMLLVPRDLHKAVQHSGGVAIIDKFGVLEDNDQ